MNKARITYRFEPGPSYPSKRDPERKAPVAVRSEAGRRGEGISETADTESKLAGGQPRPANGQPKPINGQPMLAIVEDKPTLTNLQDSEEPPAPKGTSIDPYYLDPLGNREYQSWNPPVTADADRLEQVIRDTGTFVEEPRNVPVAARRAGGSRPNRTRPGKPDYGWVRMASSVAGAVGTGMLFGFLALSLFHSGSATGRDTQSMLRSVLDPGSKIGAMSTQTGTNTDAPAGAAAKQPPSGDASRPASAKNSGAITLPGETYYVIQNGVFHSEQSASDEVQNLKNAGVSGAAVAAGKDVLVLAGIAPNRDQALMLSQMLRDSGVDVYIKQMDLPTELHPSWGGQASAAQAQAFFTRGRALAQLLDQLTVGRLEDTVPKALDASSQKQLQQAHQAWIQDLAVLESGLPRQETETLDNMAHAMNSAVLAFDEYNKHPAKSALWQIQADVNDYLQLEQQAGAATAEIR